MYTHHTCIHGNIHRIREAISEGEEEDEDVEEGVGGGGEKRLSVTAVTVKELPVL